MVREGGGRGVQGGEYVLPRGEFLLMYGENQCNIVKVICLQL